MCKPDECLYEICTHDASLSSFRKFCGGKNSAYNKAAVKSQLAKEIPQEIMSTKKKKLET